MRIITANDLLEWLDIALKPLGGKVVSAKTSVSSMVREAIEAAGGLPDGILEDSGQIFVDTEDLGKIRIISTRPTYKPDKRKYNGEGNRIDTFTIELTGQIPGKLLVARLPQKMSYDVAKANKERLEFEIEELQDEIAKRQSAVSSLVEVMAKHKYD